MIFHRADPLQNHPLLAALPQVTAGFTLLPPASRSASLALDYFRAPLFDWPTGVAVSPSTGPGANDDLQDALITYLKQLRDQDGELFVFGANTNFRSLVNNLPPDLSTASFTLSRGSMISI